MSVHILSHEHPGGKPGVAVSCRACGSTDNRLVPSDRGPHFAVIECAACGAYIKYAPKPITSAEAREFKILHGPYYGARLSELAETADGRSYLMYLSRGRGGKACRMASVVLADLAKGVAR